MVLDGREIRLSPRLKRSEVESFRASWEAGTVPDTDWYHVFSVDGIVEVVASTPGRCLTVLTATEQVEISGFESEASKWAHRLGIDDRNHAPLGPLSNVVEAAVLLAELACLSPQADLRSSQVRFGSEQVSRQPAGAEDQGPVMVRPWLPIGPAVLALVAVTALYINPLAGEGLEARGFSPYWILLLPVLAGLGVLDVIAGFAWGLRIDGLGIHGIDRTRNRRIEWADVALVESNAGQATESQHGGVTIVRSDGTTVGLPSLTKRQLVDVAGAISAFGGPYGLGFDQTPDLDRSEPPAVRKHVRSPIAIEVFGRKL